MTYERSFRLPIGVPTTYKTPLSGSVLTQKMEVAVHIVTKLPSGIEINYLIDDLRKLSWEAAETLLYYSQILKDPNNKSNILKNEDKKNPVTIADLKVNEIIIQRINEKYKNVNWDILSEESVKVSADSFNINSEGF